MMHERKLSLAEQLKRESHRICSLILNSDLDWIDIAIQVDQMRWLCLSEAPDKAELFEQVYVSRFHRLWDQWRNHQESPDDLPEWLRPREWRPSDDDAEGDLAC